MSAEEVKNKIQGVITELQVARLSVISAMNRVTDSLPIIQGIQSDAPDARMSVEGLNHIEQLLLTATDEMERTKRDLNNFRQVL